MSYLALPLSSGFLANVVLAALASASRSYPPDKVLVLKYHGVDDLEKEFSSIQDCETKPNVKYCVHRRLTIGLQKNHFARGKRGHSYFHVRTQRREQRINNPISQSCGRRNGSRK